MSAPNTRGEAVSLLRRAAPTIARHWAKQIQETLVPAPSSIVEEGAPLPSEEELREPAVSKWLTFALRIMEQLAESLHTGETRAVLDFLRASLEAGELRGFSFCSAHGALSLLEDEVMDALQSRWPDPTWRETQTTLRDLFHRLDLETGELFLEAQERTIKHQEEQLRRQESLAVLGSFASTMAHEVRTPLTSIKMNLQMLEEKTQGSSLAPHFTITRREVERLEKLVRDTLSFGRPLALQCRPSSPAALLDSALRSLGEKMSAKSIVVHRSTQLDLPSAWVDPDLILSVFTNLVENAIDAMEPRGTLTLTVTHSWSEAFPALVVEIRDTGCGIAEEVWPTLFDPFYTSKRTGTGLGLPIAQHIIRQHGGQIRFTSQVGKGTAFFVLLPIHPTESQIHPGELKELRFTKDPAEQRFTIDPAIDTGGTA
ncbi:MAG: ATP-binding protein [Coprothermobacterota bacterium]|nr:ATP-binding protein [Coprothermobacterota bacterium]